MDFFFLMDYGWAQSVLRAGGASQWHWSLGRFKGLLGSGGEAGTGCKIYHRFSLDFFAQGTLGNGTQRSNSRL